MAVCLVGWPRRRRSSSRDNLRQPASVGERVSTDIKDVNTVALGGYRYSCIFVDEYSGEKRVYSMKRKTDLVDAASCEQTNTKRHPRVAVRPFFF